MNRPGMVQSMEPIFKLKRWLIYSTLLVAAVSWCGPSAAETPESVLLFKIYSTKTLTRHLGLGYDHSSLRKLARRIGPDEVPTLIKMFQEPERDNRSDVGFAIASQCSAGLAGLLRMVDAADTKDSLNPQAKPSRVPYETRLAATTIVGFEECDADTQGNAQAFVERIDLRLKASAARSIDRKKRERQVKNQQNRQVLESYGDGSIRTVPRPTVSTAPNERQ